MQLARSSISSAGSHVRLERLFDSGRLAILEIAQRWNVKAAEVALLIGTAQGLTLEVAVTRMSHVLGIHRSLTVLFGRGADSAVAWLHAPSFAPLFAGDRPIDVILRSDEVALRKIRGYLECQLVA